MTPRLRDAALLGSVLLAAGCGAGEPTSVHLPKPPPSSAAEPPPPPYTSPARWSFHPPTPSSATAVRALADGGCLITTADGLRFRAARAAKDGARTVCSGRAEAAEDMAPEPLVAMAQRLRGSWTFVGQSGALYEAEGPLAPLRRGAPSPSRFEHIASGGATVVGSTMSGELYRLHEGAIWMQVQTAERVFDVAVSDDGRALALAFPEALLTSDDGARWKRASAETIGARRLGRDEAGDLAAQGITATLTWTPKEPAPFARRREPLPEDTLALALEPSFAPSATAVVEGRAVLDGDRYLEVTSPDDGENFVLLAGPLEGPLAETKLQRERGCTSHRIGARGRHVVIACLLIETGREPHARIRVSSDGGARFGEPEELQLGDEPVRVAVSSEGHALITGVCKARSSVGKCAGAGPMLARVEEGKLVTTLAVTPPIEGAPISPAFSVDGRSAYFLARRGKDARLALFVSHDAGATFSARAIDASAFPSFASSSSAARAQELDDGEAISNEDPDGDLEPGDLTALRPGDDGTLGIVLMTSRGLVYLTTDDAGRPLGLTRPPVDHCLLGGHGRRAVAFSTLSDANTGGDVAWESLDGGATWTSMPGAQSLAQELSAGPLTIACSGSGCLVGDSISRVGWNGQVNVPRLARPGASAPSPAIATMRAPIVCEIDPRAGFTRIEDVESTALLGLPRVEHLARGRALWSILSVDLPKSAARVTAALLPERGEGEPRVTTRPLFAPALKGASFAMDVSHQMEGYAVARVKVPPLKGPGLHDTAPPGAMRAVELAWENFMDGASGKARLPDAGPFVRRDIFHKEDHKVLNASLVSVTPGAIFISPHASGPTGARTYLLDLRGKLRAFTYPRWGAFLAPGLTEVRSDATLVGDQILAVGSMDDDANAPLGVLLGRLAEEGANVEGAWTATAVSLGPGTSDDGERIVDSDWTYLDPKTIGHVVFYSVPREDFAATSFHPFRKDGTFGPAVALPTPYDLPALPRPCTAEERRATPRFAAHAFRGGRSMYPGIRHPVLLVPGPNMKVPFDEPRVMATAGVVLHGTKEAPCVAAWEVLGFDRTPIVAVISGDLARGFLFRALPPRSAPIFPGDPPARKTLAVEHRPMTCRFDPTAKVPDEIANAPGMLPLQP